MGNVPTSNPPSFSVGVVLNVGGVDPLGRFFIYVAVRNSVERVLSVVWCALHACAKHPCQSVDQHNLDEIAFPLTDVVLHVYLLDFEVVVFF